MESNGLVRGVVLEHTVAREELNSVCPFPIVSTNTQTSLELVTGKGTS